MRARAWADVFDVDTWMACSMRNNGLEETLQAILGSGERAYALSSVSCRDHWYVQEPGGEYMQTS
eukprot:12402388-Alexandrium_andersonii.AAC.1